MTGPNPIQRAWRDLHAINMHGALAYEVNQEMFGRMLLGLPPNTTLISAGLTQINQLPVSRR